MALFQDISTNNKQTARRLARCKSSGDTNAALKQLLAEHKRRQTEFRRNRDLQIKKLHAKLHDHLSTRPAMPKADVVSPACVVVEQPANVTKESTHAEVTECEMHGRIEIVSLGESSERGGGTHFLSRWVASYNVRNMTPRS